MSEPVFQFGEFELHCGRFQLLRRGRPLRAEPKPLDLLILLVSRRGHLVTRREIVEKLWESDVFVDTDHSINAAIRKLRHLLRDDSETPKYIETVTGMGYRFVAPINQIEPGGTEAPAAAPVPSQAISTHARLKAESVDGESFDQPSPTLPAKPEVRSSPRRWHRIAMIAASTLLSVLLLDWLDRPEPPLPKITRTLQLTSDGREKFPRVVTDGVRVYFVELRNAHWTLCAIPASGGETTAIPLPFPDVDVLNISPDKSELLIGEGPPISDNPLWRVPILGGSPRRMGNIVAHSATWSPDGRKLMFMREGDPYLANADGSDPRKVELPQTTPNTWVWSPRWSPDGSRITFERYIMDKHLSAIWEVSALGEHPHLLLPNWQEPPMQCCGEWSPDGSLFFFDVWNHLEGGAPIAPAPDIWVIRKQSPFVRKTSAKPTQLTAGPVHFISHVFSTDGTSLFTVSTQRREELTQFDSKAKRFAAYPGLGPAHSISFSRDGWVAYTKFPQGELWRKKADGSESLQLTFRPLMTYGPQWSPDGKQIVFYGQEPGQGLAIYIVSAQGGEVRKIGRETPAQSWGPHWSADGASLVFWSSDDAGTMNIEMFNLQTHQLSKVPGSEGLVWPQWSPDGKYISALSDSGLMLFDVKENRWSTLLKDAQARSQAWSNDGKSLYFISSRPQPGVFRLSITDKKVREVASLSGVRVSDTLGQPLFLTPQDEPLVRQQTEMETEIYALFWDRH